MPEDTSAIRAPQPQNKVNISLDLRLVVGVLLLVIAAMLLLWRPWSQSDASKDARTIAVSGDAKIQATPDQFMFYPTYEFKDPNKDTALASLTKKSNDITTGLKKLGVAESDIKTNADGYNRYGYYMDRTSGQNVYSLSFTVTVKNKELAQKVQDYLVSTTPTGQVSPQASFSDAKRKELESKARDEATKAARAKAEQSAKNLGFKVGKVKSIDDGSMGGGIEPFRALDSSAATSSGEKAASLPVQPGQNDLNYTVRVVYYIR